MTSDHLGSTCTKLFVLQFLEEQRMILILFWFFYFSQQQDEHWSFSCVSEDIKKKKLLLFSVYAAVSKFWVCAFVYVCVLDRVQ